MSEIAIVVDSISSSVPSYFMPDSILEKKIGYGSSARSLSGVPMEIVRGKRVESVTLNFGALRLDEYEFFLYLWENGLTFDISGRVPKMFHEDCFIALDGFNLVLKTMDTYEGSLVILVP